jgi:putative chitobiose transport system permease protein
LSLGIVYLAGFAGDNDRALAAGTVMSLIPIVIVFLTMQRHIMVSMSGAVKG